MIEGPPEFTPEQINSIQAGGEFAEQLLETCTSPYDAGFMPNDGLYTRVVHTQPDAAGNYDVYHLQGYNGASEPQLLSRVEPNPVDFTRPEYVSYSSLPVTFTGVIDLSNSADHGVNSADYWVYRVRQPGDPRVHEGGVVMNWHTLLLEYDKPSAPGDIITTSELVSEPRILDADEIRTLGATLRHAVEHGNTVEP